MSLSRLLVPCLNLKPVVANVAISYQVHHLPGRVLDGFSDRELQAYFGIVFVTT